MFTGIIKGKGSIHAIDRSGGDSSLSVRAAGFGSAELDEGDSVSVNGVCLTATNLVADGFRADVSAETLRVTTIGSLVPGSSVNLEPALAAGDRLGGHLVSGHVDCVGTVRQLADVGQSLGMTIEIPAEYRKYIVRKGSICIDGVSLTINRVSGNAFELNIIPHTATVTTLGDLKAGARVNVEVDQLARYLERLLEERGQGLSKEFLEEHGYG